MKSIYAVLGILVVFTCATTASAASDNSDRWTWKLDVVGSDPAVPDCTRSFFGVWPDCNEYGGPPQEIRSDYPRVFAATYHDSSFYTNDFRKPGAQIRWLIYVWATPAEPTPTDSILLVLQNYDGPYFPSNYVFSLTLVSKPDEVEGGPTAGAKWDMDMAPLYLTLPMYRTDNGLTGYQFEFSATAVPEPSAFIALACGLVGILTRTRKRRSL